jgi:hypothetical protein
LCRHCPNVPIFKNVLNPICWTCLHVSFFKNVLLCMCSCDAFVQIFCERC